MHSRNVVALVFALAQPVEAQAAPAAPCAPLCAPVVVLMPALLHSHLLGGPRVRDLTTGAVSRLPSTSNMEIIIAGAAKTMVDRVSLFGSVQWLPNASEQRNPFTHYAATELGGHVHANAPTLTVGASVTALSPPQTGGWADAAVNIGDLYSQAARPDDRSAYTHKLDLDLVTHWHVFNTLPAGTYAHRVSIFAILDYVATGLPRAGDQVPKGRVFLDDARPLSLIAGLALPITPEVK